MKPVTIHLSLTGEVDSRRLAGEGANFTGRISTLTCCANARGISFASSPVRER
jgi:hypothetical protein